MELDMETEATLTEPEAPAAPRVPLPPITNRFLFVDIAALRAKQLRRGALPRIDETPDPSSTRDAPHKAERVAMEEVRRGFVEYDLPPLKLPNAAEQGEGA
jgi:DNA-directed RNA polymerase subunit K/omega